MATIWQQWQQTTILTKNQGMIQQIAQNRPARPAPHSPGLCPGRWSDTKRTCALQGQNHQTCPKGAVLAGRRWVVAYSPRAARRRRRRSFPNYVRLPVAFRSKAEKKRPGLGDAAPAGRLCAMNNWLFWTVRNVLKCTDIEQFAKT